MLKKRLRWYGAIALVAMLILVPLLAACAAEEEETPAAEEPPVAEPTLAEQLGYVGSEKCGSCHADKYSTFKVTGHPWKLKTAEVAKSNPLPLPEG